MVFQVTNVQTSNYYGVQKEAAIVIRCNELLSNATERVKLVINKGVYSLGVFNFAYELFHKSLSLVACILKKNCKVTCKLYSQYAHVHEW